MSTEVEKTVPNPIEETQERVERLAEMVENIDSDYAELSQRLNRQLLEHQDRLDQRVNAALFQLRREVEAALRNMQVTFNDRVKDEMRKVTADEVAAALSRTILVTRQATREEMGRALITRQATAKEINQTKAS